MKFVSTRGSEPYSFCDAVTRGLAPDGGLFVPETLPQLDLKKIVNGDFIAVAVETLRPFMEEDFTEKEIRLMTEKAFYFPIPLRKIDSQTSVLELFHGPTAAFKDIAAQFLGEMLSKINTDPDKTILVATSGDTGGAIAAAFDGRPGFRVVILFPKNGVSQLQKQQLTCWGHNIKSLAVEGSFDDCQRMVKSILSHSEYQSEFHLTSANSINIGRLLPQTCYYAASSLWWWAERKQKASYVIPTGNMGNAVAAFWARKMGFPIENIMMATNANKVIPEYFQSGHFEARASVATLANAMDVGNPSNFERLRYLHPERAELLSFSGAESVSDDEIRWTVREAHRKYGTIVCPHTATAFAIREKLPGNWIVVATAHPAKFSESIEPLIAEKIPVPPSLQELYHRPSKYDIILPEEKQVISVLGGS